MNNSGSSVSEHNNANFDSYRAIKPPSMEEALGTPASAALKTSQSSISAPPSNLASTSQLSSINGKSNTTPAYFTSAPFLEPPTPTQLTEMENFSPTPSQILSELEAKYRSALAYQRAEELSMQVQIKAAGKLDYVQTEEQTAPPPSALKEDEDEDDNDDAAHSQDRVPRQVKELESSKEMQDGDENRQSRDELTSELAFQTNLAVETSERLNDLLKEVIPSPKGNKKSMKNAKRAIGRVAASAKKAIVRVASSRKGKDERKLQKYDDETIKFILSNFYAVREPEKLHSVDAFVDNWVGDKMLILQTLEDKYAESASTWRAIVAGSWIPNTQTKFSSNEYDDNDVMNQVVANLISQYKENHGRYLGRDSNFSVSPPTSSCRVSSPTRENCELVKEQVKKSIFSKAATTNKTIEPASFANPDTIDIIIHELKYKVNKVERAQAVPNNWEWANKIKRKRVRMRSPFSFSFFLFFFQEV